MASVAPQHMVTCCSGSSARPLYAPARRAIALRSAGAPHVTAYWFLSASIARRAASFIGSGAGKSGKPWARFTPPSRVHTRDISRITDSVKREALAEVRGRIARPSYHGSAGAAGDARSGQLVGPLAPRLRVLAEVLLRQP